MRREFSAGGIVFNDKEEVLITQHSSNKHWSFPKGHIEEGQTSTEAALREVKEEGGIEAKIIDKVGENKYIYTNSQTKEKIFKVVKLFLMEYLSGDIADHDWEVSEAKWVSVDEAVATLTFSTDKDLLKKAVELLRSFSS